MKKSAILCLFDGIRQELHTPQCDEQTKEEMCNAYDLLEKELSAELFEVFKKYEFELSSRWYEEMDYYIVECFKLGLRVGLECADGED